MGVDEADQLLKMLTDASGWPLFTGDNVGGLSANVYAQAGSYGKSLRDLALWVALRESDRDQIVQLLGKRWSADRDYRVDPLADRIAQTFSDLLFGENPQIAAAAESDQSSLDEMLEENDFPSELRRWAADCSSEGEVWWRVYVNRDVSEWPIVEGHSRLNTVPLFQGRRVAAVAFWEDYYTQDPQVENSHTVEVWRYVQIQTDGLVRNHLFQGTFSNLGGERPLGMRPETAQLDESWEHGLPVMLAGRIPNKLGRDWRLGISDYQGIRDLLLDLNEARTVAAENARISAKKRMLVPAAALDEDGNFDASEDVIPIETLDDTLDSVGKNTGPYAVLEYDYQAAPLIEHMDDLITTALTRVGLAEQFVNGGNSRSGGGGGQAVSGTALRTRLIPTTLAASGKARYWDDGVPRIVHAMTLVAALPREKGGCGQAFVNTKDLPAMTRSSVLPEDPTEEVNRHVTAVAGEVESVETAVRALNEDREETWITEELDRIQKDRQLYGINEKPGGDGGGGGDSPPLAPGGAFSGKDGPPSGPPANGEESGAAQ